MRNPGPKPGKLTAQGGTDVATAIYSYQAEDGYQAGRDADWVCQFTRPPFQGVVNAFLSGFAEDEQYYHRLAIPRAEMATRCRALIAAVEGAEFYYEWQTIHKLGMGERRARQFPRTKDRALKNLSGFLALLEG